MIRSTIAAAVVAAGALSLASVPANAYTLDFETGSAPSGGSPGSLGIGSALVHGTVIDGAYVHDPSGAGVSISTTNGGGGPNFAVVFDTSEDNTRDPDLEAPFSGPAESLTADGGFDLLSVGDFAGNILVVQENGDSCSQAGDVCDNPDDEAGGRNTIAFDFTDGPITAESLDLFDLDGDQDEEAIISFFDPDGELVDSITVTGAEIGGDNHAARVDFTSVFEGGVKNVSEILVDFSSSGATGNLVYSMPPDDPDPGEAPEPGSLALLAGGALGLIAVRRRAGR